MKKTLLIRFLPVAAILFAASPASAFLCVEPLPPTVTFSPGDLDFGSTPKDGTKPLPVVVTYHSQRQFYEGVCVCRCSQPSTATISLSASTPLNFSANPATFTLSEEQSRTVDVTFNPQGIAGTFSGTVTAGFSAGSQTFPLTVTGVAFTGESNIQVNPTSLDFGLTEVGTMKSKTLNLSNQGTATLTGTLSTSAPFSSLSTNFSIAPGASVNVSVRFTPSVTGPAAGQFRINSNDPDAGTIGIGLTGTGAVPALNVSPSSLDFGTFPLGEVLTKTIRISNNSCASCPDPLTLNLSNFASNKPQYTFGAPSDASLAPGESATVQVTFTPTSTSNVNATLSFNTTDPLYPSYSCPLTGEAEDSALNPSTLNLNFGDTHLGSTVLRTFTLLNEGPGSRTISNISASSSRVTVTPASFTLAAGASRLVEVRYSPTATSALTMHYETLNGTLTVSSNDPDLGQFSLDLSGRGTSPLVSAMPLDFGTVYMNTPITGVLNVDNDGNEPLVVSNLISNKTAFTPLETSFTVPPGGSRVVPVRYNPTAEGPLTAALTLTSNDFFNPTANLTALGSAVSELDLSLDRMEVTQAIQDADNSVDLVAGKATAVRVFIGSTIRGLPNASNTIRNIDGVLHVKKNGVAIPGSPFASHNGPIAVVPHPDAAKTNDTLNFLVPGDRLAISGESAEAEFSVQVNPAAGGRVAQSKESGYANNSGVEGLILRSTYSPKIDYIPISVSSGSVLYSLPPSAAMSEGTALFAKIFPVANLSYNVRPPVFFNRDITYANHHELTALLFRAGHLGTGTPPDRTFGWFPLNYRPAGGFIGIAEDIPGRVAMGGNLENMAEAQVVFAHEIGHTYGLCHTNYEDSCYAGYWDYHEIGFTDIQETGFDTGLMKAMPDVTDFMKSSVGPNYWIHPQRYAYLMTRLATREADPANARGCHHFLDCQSLVQNVALVTGAIAADGSARLDPVYGAQSVPDEPLSEASTEGAYRLQGLNAAGEILYDRPLAEGGDSAFEGDGEKDTTFSLIIPSLEGLATVRIVKDGDVAASRSVTEGELALEITSPVGGEFFGDILQVAWSCNGHEEKEISYSVLYSPDGVANFQAIGVDLSDTSLLYDVSKLPGGNNAIVRVVATDGVRTVAADSAPFRIARKSPVVTIVSPQDGQTFFDGSQIPLTATAADAEDGVLPSTSVRWVSDLAGTIGAGREISADLPIGLHVLTATGTDADGNAASFSVTLRVAEGTSSPRADAGPGQTVDERDSVILDAGDTVDPDEGEALSYEWSQVSGPSVLLDDSLSIQTGFKAPDVHSDAQLRFQIKVTDAAGHVGTDFVDVLVKNVFYPSLEISDALVDFGDASSGESFSRSVTVTNQGNETLDVRNIVSSRSAFSADPNEFSLAQGESKTVTIRFEPNEEANFDSNLRFVSNTVPGTRTMLFVKGQTTAAAKSFRDNGLGGNLLPEAPEGEAPETDAGLPAPAAKSAGGCSLAR